MIPSRRYAPSTPPQLPAILHAGSPATSRHEPTTPSAAQQLAWPAAPHLANRMTQMTPEHRQLRRDCARPGRALFGHASKRRPPVPPQWNPARPKSRGALSRDTQRPLKKEARDGLLRPRRHHLPSISKPPPHLTASRGSPAAQTQLPRTPPSSPPAPPRSSNPHPVRLSQHPPHTWQRQLPRSLAPALAEVRPRSREGLSAAPAQPQRLASWPSSSHSLSWQPEPAQRRIPPPRVGLGGCSTGSSMRPA